MNNAAMDVARDKLARACDGVIGAAAPLVTGAEPNKERRGRMLRDLMIEVAEYERGILVAVAAATGEADNDEDSDTYQGHGHHSGR